MTYKNACAYIRVSTDKQEELSPDAQKRLIIDYAKNNNLILINEHIFIENGISGRKADKRPAFQSMIGLAKSKEHPIDVILVWKFSRFARNQEESIVYKSLLKKNGVEVISISEPLVDGPFGSLIERIIEWMDEYYSIRLSGEVIRGMTEKALRGGYQSAPPLGYVMDKNTGVPVIEESSAAIVRKIYALYEKGCSNVEICRTLNDAGYRTRKGNTFESRTITYILTNPFYCGKIRWNRQDHSTSTIRSQSEWIIADGIHEKLFDEEYYNHIQSLVMKRKKPQKAHSVGTMKYWLSGMVKCSTCGTSLVTSVNKSSYQCGAYNKGACQVSHHIKTSALEQAVYSGLNDILTGAAPLNFELRKNTPSADNDIENIQKQLDRLEFKLERIKQAYRDGIDTLEEYKENKSIILKEKEELSQMLTTATSLSDSSGDKLMEKIKNVYSIVTDENNDMRTRALALRSVVERCVYDKENDELKIYFYTLD